MDDAAVCYNVILRAARFDPVFGTSAPPIRCASNCTRRAWERSMRMSMRASFPISLVSSLVRDGRRFTAPSRSTEGRTRLSLDLKDMAPPTTALWPLKNRHKTVSSVFSSPCSCRVPQIELRSVRTHHICSAYAWSSRSLESHGLGLSSSKDALRRRFDTHGAGGGGVLFARQRRAQSGRSPWPVTIKLITAFD
jgi:hypothetical protein